MRITFSLDMIIENAIANMVEQSVDEQSIDVCRDYDDLHDIVVIGCGYEKYLQDDDDYNKFVEKLKFINIDELNKKVEEVYENGFESFRNIYRFDI